MVNRDKKALKKELNYLNKSVKLLSYELEDCEKMLRDGMYIIAYSKKKSYINSDVSHDVGGKITVEEFMKNIIIPNKQKKIYNIRKRIVDIKKLLHGRL